MPEKRNDRTKREPITKSKLTSLIRLVRKPFSDFLSFNLILNISLTNWTIFLMTRNERNRKNRMPRIPISLRFVDISWAFLNSSGDIFEKKSGENGYIPLMVVLGLPRNLVKMNVKKVSRNREENMEYKARMLDLSKPSSFTNSFRAVHTFFRMLNSFNFIFQIEIITYQ